MKTAFDTNYLLRHIMQDDAAQAAVVAKCVAEAVRAGETVLLPELALAETVWTLASYYGLKRDAIAEVLSELARDSAFEMENPERVRRALAKFKSGKAHFPDYLITAAAEERGAKLKSFDRALDAQ
jgi:predicted nucleic-acid-binding protein